MFIIIERYKPIDRTTPPAYSSGSMQVNSFADALTSFRLCHNLSQLECAALIPYLSVRSLEKWERGASAPPLWSQCLILDALHDAMTSD